MPLIVPVPPTEVTVPEPLLLKVFQSVLVKYPLALDDAAAMLIAGVAPPEETTGAVPVTLVTVPEPLLLNVVQSVFVRYPLTRLVAAGMDKWLADVPAPANGESTVTAVRYEPAGCLPLKVFQSVLVK
jgi:hypothetical protein